jgi:hypothetical protein
VTAACNGTQPSATTLQVATSTVMGEIGVNRDAVGGQDPITSIGVESI